MVSETRYMRNDNKLGTSESASLVEDYCDAGKVEYYGIRVYVLHADSSRTEVLSSAGNATAVVSLLAGTALTTTLNARFIVMYDVVLDPSDEIQIDVFADFSNPPTVLIEQFTTSGLNATMLLAGNWKIYYRVRRTAKIGPYSFFYFRFGTSGDDSYITTFQYTPSTIAQDVVGDGLTLF